MGIEWVFSGRLKFLFSCRVLDDGFVFRSQTDFYFFGWAGGYVVS
jgi:hypothetical protein